MSSGSVTSDRKNQSFFAGSSANSRAPQPRRLRILHLLSQRAFTGAEAAALTLADEQVAQGHTVFVVSDTLTWPTKAQVTFAPISQRRPLSRLRNLFFLRRFLLAHDVDVVHCHSRAASWVAHFALKYLFIRKPIAFVSTVHGRQHLHRSSVGRQIYGHQIMAVCENLKSHLERELQLKHVAVTVVRNGFNFDARADKFLQKSSVVRLVGRSSDKKGERFAWYLNEVIAPVMRARRDFRVEIIGGTLAQFEPGARRLVEAFAKEFGSRFSILGFKSDLATELATAHVVVAAGRVAIEAVALGVPTIALGESEAIGFAQRNLSRCLDSNFGDCTPATTDCFADADFQRRELLAALEMSGFDGRVPPVGASQHAEREARGDTVKNELELAAKKIEELYSLEQIVDQTEKVYFRAIAKAQFPCSIPALMYHKVPATPLKSKHKIFVTADVFESHLRALKRAGLESLRFSDYIAYRSGLKTRAQLPQKPIFITADDAYLDNFTHAWPLLKKYGFGFTIFALGDDKILSNSWDAPAAQTTAALPGARVELTTISQTQQATQQLIAAEPEALLMSVEQRRQLAAEGVEFGSHGMSHRDLTTLSDQEMRAEVEASRAAVADQLQLPPSEVQVFCYPYGIVGEREKKAVERAGYGLAVATDSGGLHIEDDPFQIFRANVFPTDAGAKYLRKASASYRMHFYKTRGH